MVGSLQHDQYTDDAAAPPLDAKLFEGLMQQKDWNRDTTATALAAAATAATTTAALVGLALLTQSHAGTDLSSVVDAASHVPQQLWSSYQHVLSTNPIPTKAMTSATVYTIGDIIAQQTEKSEGDDNASLDVARVVRSLLAGLIGHGPMSHLWYNASEGFFNDVLHLTAWWSFLPKIAVDQALFAPIWNNSYLLLLGLMKGDSLETIWSDVQRTTIPLMVSGLKLWPLVHCVTYGVMPVQHRLLWVDAVEILWVTILATQAAGEGKEEDGETTTTTLAAPQQS